MMLASVASVVAPGYDEVFMLELEALGACMKQTTVLRFITTNRLYTRKTTALD